MLDIIACTGCGIISKKPLAEVARNKQKNGKVKMFCSRSCFSRYNWKQQPIKANEFECYECQTRCGIAQLISGLDIADVSLRKLFGFCSISCKNQANARIQMRAAKVCIRCNTKYEKNNWAYCSHLCQALHFKFFSRMIRNAKKRDKGQVSICFYDLQRQWSKQNGKCIFTGREMNDVVADPFKASLDRIDSNKGYHKDNIQFVCTWAQWAKGRLANKQLIAWCKLVARHNTPQNMEHDQPPRRTGVSIKESGSQPEPNWEDNWEPL